MCRWTRTGSILFLAAALTSGTRADDVESFLARHGLDRLLAVHLEGLLESLPASERQDTVLRLAELYASLLEETNDPALRAELEERSRALLALASASAGQDLRLALLRGPYRKAEQIAENHRLRQSNPQDVEAAREILSDVIPKLTRLRGQIAERLTAVENRLMRATGAEAINTAQEAERIQALHAQCTFLTAWALYYQSWLHGRPDNARAAEELFATLVGADSSRPQPEDVSVDLRSEEAVSRAILGMALCKSMTASSAVAIRWLDLLDHEQGNAVLREQAPAWRMAVHLEHGEYGAAAAILAAERRPEEPVPLAWLRLAAVGALEARRGDPQAGELARRALAQIAARGELQTVLDLCDRYGVEALGGEGFAIRYVQGVRRYQQARREHGGEEPTDDPRLAGLYGAAAAEFEAASAQGDADRYPEAAASCRRLIGWCEFFAGRFAAAARSFELAADHLPPGQAADALWMAVVALDRAVQAGGASAVQLDALIDAVLARLPAGPNAARLRLRRAMGSPPSQDAVEELLSIEPDSPVYEAARRRAAGMLYELFRGASGHERAARGTEFLAVALPLVDAGPGGQTDVEARIALLRRVLEVALADEVGRVAAAERALDALAALGGEPGADLAPFADEIDYRRVQVRLAGGDPDRAAVIADALWQRGRDSAWSRLAQAALFGDALRRFKEKQDRAWLAQAIRHGRRVVSEFEGDPEALRRPRVLAAHAALAEALLEAGEGDSASDAEALALYERLLDVRPADAGFLRGTAILSERLGRTDQAISCWRTLVAGTPATDTLWYEAKFRLISLLAETDPARARAVMDQHKQLNPGYGPEPWASRLSELDRRIPAEAAPS